MIGKIQKEIYPFKSIHHVDQKTLDYFFNSYSPVFFLNTGRSGSAFFDNSFKKIKGVNAYHEAFPNLMMFPNFAYRNQDNPYLLKKIFEAARLELILDAFVQRKVFVETNHCLVFFAYQIKQLFPKAKFVHVVRHPGDFVRSAIMKGWHKNDTIWENNRLRLADDGIWNKMTQIEKLAWLWNETHLFINNFLNTIDNQNKIILKLEEVTFSIDKFREMISFINEDFQLDRATISKIQAERINENIIGDNEPPNMFKLSKFPKYDDWNEEMKNELKSQCGNLSIQYNYLV